MEMLVIADEIIREMRYIMDGVEVSERTLAREAIHRARPGSGFLADDHTLHNWKWAQWQPALIDRLRHDAWVDRGSKDMATRAFQLEIAAEEARFNEKLRNVVSQFARSEEFAVILEIGAVAYAAASVDVSTGIIDAFNKAYPGSAE